MYKLVFFVPGSHLEIVKQALFKKGAGEDESYQETSWEVLGKMQFKPKPGSHPEKGKIGQLVCSEEYRVEMICKEETLRTVVQTLLEAHPYEKPAYEIYSLHQLEKRQGP